MPAPAECTRKLRHAPRKKNDDDCLTEVVNSSPRHTSSKTRARLVSNKNNDEILCPSPRSDSGGRRNSRNSSRSVDTTPSRAKKSNGKENTSVTPVKRKGGDHDLSTHISPAKINKCDDIIKCTISSPSVRLSRLSLNSPKSDRSPLRSKDSIDNRAKRGGGGLFSPKKLSSDIITDMLFNTSSDGKCNKSKSIVKNDKSVKNNNNNENDEVVFKKPVNVVRTPIKRIESPCKRVSPGKASKSPLKGLTQDALEDLLCSPLKSPRRSSKASPPKPSPKSNGRKASPLKISNSGDLESLLCSPAKSPSPVKLTKNNDSSVANESQKNANVMRSPRKPLTPMKSPRKAAANLFNSPVRSLVSELPSTLVTNKVDVSQLQVAKLALHTGTPGELLCRGEQVTAMSDWLDKHLLDKKSGSLYVSGAPGTGKTATLTHLLNNKNGKYKSIFINCMVLKSSADIFKEVAKQMNPKASAKTEKEALKVIEKCLTAKGEMILLVLDEVDQLESKNQDVLYTVFEWPALPSSRLSLIGIANTLDLTDRVLPRLQIKECYRPTLINYPPYTKQQIIEIITKRLAGEGVNKEVVTTRAIAYLATKISSLSGDIRKALDVCRRALEQAETNAKKQSFIKSTTGRSLGSPLTSPQKGYKTARPVTSHVGQVDLPQIMKVINQVYGSKISSSMSTAGCGLPTQQKIMIASLLLLVKKGSSKEVTLGKLMQTYTKVCKKRGMLASDELECVGMVQGLESRGMLKYHCKSAAPRYAKITLRLDENEVGIALQDKTLLSSIVEDVSCLE